MVAELWYLAYSDLLAVPTPNSSIPHPVVEPDGMDETRSSRSPPAHTTSAANPALSSSKRVSRARSESAVNRSVRHVSMRIDPVPTTTADPVRIRALWHRIESRPDCLMPFPVYLLRPGRHFRQYCVLFGSLLTKYAPSHPDLIACKAVFTRFVQLARSVYTAYRHAEQIVVILQSARSVLPIFGFLGLLPTPPQPSTGAGATGETDLPVPRRTPVTGTDPVPCSPEQSVQSSTDWPSVTNAAAFRLHLRRMPSLHRVGWLKKYSRRGFQPRMVFLFDDRMIFASRIRGTPFLFLKIHGIISLNCAYVVKESLSSSDNPKTDNDDTATFAVVAVVDAVPAYTDETAPAASSPNSRGRSAAQTPSGILRSRSRSKSCARRRLRRKLLFCAADETSRDAWPEPRASSRAGSSLSVHLAHSLTRTPAAVEVPACLTDALLTVCWHRHLGVTHTQLLNANDCEMSSFLLRKFKHGTGWQKLWAVLSDLSLLFYKTPEDTQPLARLALLGYSVELLDNTAPVTISNGPSGSAAKRTGSGKLSTSVLQLSHGSKQYQLRAETQEILMSHMFHFSFESVPLDWIIPSPGRLVEWFWCFAVELLFTFFSTPKF
ncbi:unnamed protein product [Echinostoma caproni]|uniref:PH domain-containing protein n=1 Tax=Echinostoma caproni TaxID=27848 RepID=A0A3P8IQD6_9TREM|nr:unnamed protein product [Echinostoma caproni]